jgi:hypothetical protein
MSDARIAAAVGGLVHCRRESLSRRLSWHES